MTQAYRVTCPIEGATLLPVVLDPASAPWFCMMCRHSWWASELSEAARAQFRPALEDFGYGEGLAEIQGLVTTEIAAAFDRGTSCREDQLELVPAIGLRWLMGLTSNFQSLVAAELVRKGG